MAYTNIMSKHTQVHTYASNRVQIWLTRYIDINILSDAKKNIYIHPKKVQLRKLGWCTVFEWMKKPLQIQNTKTFYSVEAAKIMSISVCCKATPGSYTNQWGK